MAPDSSCGYTTCEWLTLQSFLVAVCANIITYVGNMHKSYIMKTILIPANIALTYNNYRNNLQKKLTQFLTA